MSEKDYPDLDKELIKIVDKDAEQEEEIFPLIDYEEVNEEDSNPGMSIREVHQKLRRKMLSIIKSKARL